MTPIGIKHVLLLLILITTSLLQVTGQTSTAVVNPIKRPDFTNAPTVLYFLIFILLIPLEIAAVYFLWNRRKHFPIAGRGSLYLAASLGLFLIATFTLSIVGFIWPLGIPCGVEFFILFCFSVPTAIIYMIRGWTLVFRLEIMNYLAETRWREEKKKMMKKYQEEQLAGTNEHTPPTPILGAQPHPKDRSGVTTILVQASPAAPSSKMSNDEEKVDPTTIPGYFFIQHRRWIDPKTLYPLVGCFSLVVILGMIFVGIFDPDVSLTNANFHSKGVLPDGVDYSSQFSPDTFLSSPVCLTYSIKLFVFEFILMLVLVPVVLWCAYRVHLDSRRQKQRHQEQADCYKLVHGTELENDHPTVGRTRGGLNLDDSENVKMEFRWAVRMCFFTSGVYFIVQYYEPGYSMLLLETSFAFLFWLSIVSPLLLSYAVSRKHRQLIERSKSAVDGKRPGDKEGTFNRLPHQRPYFTLKYIIHHVHTYEVLLAFLQKEYSSENALFYTESREFEQCAKDLEAAIPTWPSSMDGDEDEQTIDALQSSTINSDDAANKRMGHLRRASTGPPIMQRIASTPLAGANPFPHAAPPSLRPSGVSHPPPPPKHLSMDMAPAGVAPPPLHNQPSETILARGSVDALPNWIRATTHPTSGTSSSTSSISPTIAIASPTSAAATEVLPSPLASPVSPITPIIAPPSSKPTTPRVHPASTPADGTANRPTDKNSRQASVSMVKSAAALPPEAVIDFPALHAEAARLKAWADQINEDYLKRSAMYEINIPEDLNKLVQSQLAQLAAWSPTPFFEVTGEPDERTYPVPPPFPLSTLYKQTTFAVFDLIQRDSFRRFILTPAFQQLIHEADEAELARMEKQNDLTVDTAAVVNKAMQALSNTPVANPDPTHHTRRISEVRPLSGLGPGITGGGGSVIRNVSHLRRPTIDNVDDLPPDDDATLLPGTPMAIRPSPSGFQRQPSRPLNLSPRGLIAKRLSHGVDRVEEEESQQSSRTQPKQSPRHSMPLFTTQPTLTSSSKTVSPSVPLRHVDHQLLSAHLTNSPNMTNNFFQAPTAMPQGVGDSINLNGAQFEEPFSLAHE